MTIAFDWDVKPQTNVGGKAQEVLIRYNTVVTENRILYALPDVQAPAEAKINFGHQNWYIIASPDRQGSHWESTARQAG